MPERYVEAILKQLASKHYQPLKPRQLARVMGVSDQDYGTFRDAVKQLRDAGRVVMGSKNALTLPEMANRITGYFRANQRGFGFVMPEQPTAHGDLFIPPGDTGGAMDNDLVVARVYQQRRRGKSVFAGEVIQILKRAQHRFPGTLARAEGNWYVMPDGKRIVGAILIRDIGEAGPKEGEKVVAEIVEFATSGKLPVGVIVERLGQAGQTEVETRAIMRSHNLPEEFPAEALAEARQVVDAFDPDDPAERQRREDLTGELAVTIDPPDARDYDDAISLAAEDGGGYTLGVHIADVSHFVREGGALDTEARKRGTSVYFPRKVIPMLPEILSNGVCSLQEGQDRFCKSVFIRYDAKGKILGQRFAETIIRSARRMEYRQAQKIIDEGGDGQMPSTLVKLLKRMNRLAEAIRKRRKRAGMLQLDLPEVELVFDENDKVIDAVPEDESFTHTIIEMFMVEANDAVSGKLTERGRAHLRRIHPSPDEDAGKQLAGFVKACGHKIHADATRKDIQALLESVKGQPESYAVNLAVLKLMQAAEYSPMQVGHFALASKHYAHFTSPIRRYPDLTVHRLLEAYCRDELDDLPPDDIPALTELGEHCSNTERRADAASEELREVLVLEFLAGKVGEGFTGVVTGVANFGIFVQSSRFLIEGLIRVEDLGDDWWEVDASRGCTRGQRSGQTFRIGDELPVKIANVDIARRQMYLLPDRKKGPPAPKSTGRGKKAKSKPSGKSGRGGKAKSRPKPKARKKNKKR